MTDITMKHIAAVFPRNAEPLKPDSKISSTWLDYYR